VSIVRWSEVVESGEGVGLAGRVMNLVEGESKLVLVELGRRARCDRIATRLSIDGDGDGDRRRGR
jgi:hypothetical protein